MKFTFWETLTRPQRRLAQWLLVSNGVSVLLFALRVVGADSYRYWFLLWNLLLAWLPLFFVLLLTKRLKHTRWLDGWNLTLAALWLSFLPNSFYVLSDLIHLRTTGEISLLYDSVLFFSFIFNAFIGGYISVYLMHQALLKRLSVPKARAAIFGAFLLCGYAIYLGRAMRWNSWDIVLHPADILFDTSEVILYPFSHLQVVVTTGSFFLLLSITYGVLRAFVNVLRDSSKK